MLAPSSVVRIAGEIVRGDNRVDAARRGCLAALDLVTEAAAEGRLDLDPLEQPWIERIRCDLESIPPDEAQFVEEMLPVLDESKVLLSEYGL